MDEDVKFILWIVGILIVVKLFNLAPDRDPNQNRLAGEAAVNLVASTPVSTWEIYKHSAPNFTIRHPADFVPAPVSVSASHGLIIFSNSTTMLSPSSGDMMPAIDLAYVKADSPLEEWVRQYHGDPLITLQPGDVQAYQFKQGFATKTGFAFRRGSYNFLLEAITATTTMFKMAETFKL